MTDLQKQLKGKVSRGEKLFIPYITFAYPNLTLFNDLLKILQENGADAIEIGIPFSDPVADGPTIQNASAKSLKKGASLQKAFFELGKIKSSIDIPVLFMSYYNPILALGKDRFFKLSWDCGLSGVVIPDLPLEEAGQFTQEAKSSNLALASFISPTTSIDRIKKIDRECSGFIYYISSVGVTGTRDIFSSNTISRIRKVKRMVSNPLCVGFGISKESQVLKIKKIADGVIIGSAIIKIIDKNTGERSRTIKEIALFSKKIRKALDE
ncbi:MAG: tryptophan synthase subunit alpha [Candidatus Kaelpia aquatica]|nr:tryptophan synthase subunit alpha [Candidatus Kaelpia aquatica]